jgi:glycerophosphoryl diester phosphodiesterase
LPSLPNHRSIVNLTEPGRVLHDRTLDRTTDGHGFASDLGLEQIRSLDAGAGFDACFRE